METASSSTSFLTTDTMRFEVENNRLYYVVNGSAYNVDASTIGFDFRPASSNENLLNGSVTTKVIQDNGYNYDYETWVDVSDMANTASILYPHIYYNSIIQDVIDFHWYSDGTQIEFNNRVYSIAISYNMPVLTISDK